MNSDELLQEYLLEWEENFEKGTPVTPEEICREHPHLLGSLKDKIDLLNSVGWMGAVSGKSLDPLRETPLHFPGELFLDGRYRLEVLSGTGGQGEVWKATDCLMDRWVAIKISHRLLAPKGTTGIQFGDLLNEAKKLARLNHPGIVPVFDVGRDSGEWFMISEWIEGGNLSDLLRMGVLDWNKALEIACQLASALEHAHNLGIFHLDIKPANILLNLEGRAFLADFGIATGPTDQAHGIFRGTTVYAAPEQIKGQGVGAATDIWSLGLVLREMLWGDGEPGPEVGKGRVHADSIFGLIKKCLQEDPGLRPNAEQVHLELRKSVGGDSLVDKGITGEIPMNLPKVFSGRSWKFYTLPMMSIGLMVLPLVFLVWNNGFMEKRLATGAATTGSENPASLGRVKNAGEILEKGSYLGVGEFPILNRPRMESFARGPVTSLSRIFVFFEDAVEGFAVEHLILKKNGVPISTRGLAVIGQGGSYGVVGLSRAAFGPGNYQLSINPLAPIRARAKDGTTNIGKSPANSPPRIPPPISWTQELGELQIFYKDPLWPRGDGEPDQKFFVDIDCGATHTLVLDEKGQVRNWGNNSHGKLRMPANLKPACKVLCGWDSSFTLSQDGLITGWGGIEEQEMDLTSLNSKGEFVDFAISGHHLLALKQDGTLVAWGSGRLGAMNIPNDLKNVVGLGAGLGFSLALLSDGSVVGWGENTWHQMDDLQSLKGIVDIVPANQHTLFLDASGKVIVRGEGKTVPIMPLPAMGLFAKGPMGYAIDANGKIQSWGGNLVPPENWSEILRGGAGLYHIAVLKRLPR